MSDKKIGVGIIGAGVWAKYGHIASLQILNNFNIVAVSTRRKEAAQECSAEFNIPNAFTNEEELINHPDVELVVILVPAAEHSRIAKAVIAAGKDVYSEWPLTTNTEDSEELLSLAEDKKVKHVVGFQRRFSPSARYMRDLIAQGYIGTIRGVSMKVNTDAFQETMPGKYAWAFPETGFTNVLSVYFAHFSDMLFQSVGFPEKLAAITETQIPHFTIEETGEHVPNTNPNEAMVVGRLQNGGLFTIQIEGGQVHQTGVQIEITGTEGVLQVTNDKAFLNKEDNIVRGMNGDNMTFTTLSIPQSYYTLPASTLDVSSQDVAYLYDAYARDKRDNTTIASSFKDAVRQHKLIDQILDSSELLTKIAKACS